MVKNSFYHKPEDKLKALLKEFKILVLKDHPKLRISF